MTDDPDQAFPKKPLDTLDERIRAARGAAQPEGSAPQAAGLGAGLKIATEFVAAVMVGVGLGWLLDAWLETRPAFLLVFFVIGVAAGFVNIIRYARRANEAK